MPASDDPDPQSAPWTSLRGGAKGSTYDERWEQLAAQGGSVHGEADLVSSLLAERAEGEPDPTVLDAGCGTGRVAIELARRGVATIGVDRDTDLLDRARGKAPEMTWIEADLGDVGVHLDPASLDLVVLAGNVLIFLDPGTETMTVASLATLLRPGGLLVAGFQVRTGGYEPGRFDADARAAGLALSDRWSSWDRAPWTDADDYQVSVHVHPA